MSKCFVYLAYYWWKDASSESLFFFELTTLYNVPFRPITAEIWVLEVYSDFIVLYFILENLCGVKELRELGLCENQDSWRLENFLMYDGTRHWKGSASNVNSPAVLCSKQFGVFEFLSLALCVCCANGNVDYRPSSLLTFLSKGPLMS